MRNKPTLIVLAIVAVAAGLWIATRPPKEVADGGGTAVEPAKRVLLRVEEKPAPAVDEIVVGAEIPQPVTDPETAREAFLKELEGKVVVDLAAIEEIGKRAASLLLTRGEKLELEAMLAAKLNNANEPEDPEQEEAWEEQRDAFNEETAAGVARLLAPGEAERIGFTPGFLELLEQDFDKAD